MFPPTLNRKPCPSLLDEIAKRNPRSQAALTVILPVRACAAFVASLLQSSSPEPAKPNWPWLTLPDRRPYQPSDGCYYAPQFQQLESFGVQWSIALIFRENIRCMSSMSPKAELLEDFSSRGDYQSGFYKHVYSAGLDSLAANRFAALRAQVP
ncbi:hypothetical protein KCP75_05010 [Salmonella enterica subsp. enterica]|nr:hypothetical protein KCP75_05010 [Salmonella enterica subsp. enterica]